MRFLSWLTDCPWTFHYLRKIPEWNYHATKRMIQTLCVRDVPTLDLGCGTAEFADCFDPEAYVGVDLSRRYLTFVRGRRPQTALVQACGGRLPMASGRCAQVLINGVLHHLDDRASARLLQEAARVLAPDGRLLLIEDVHLPKPSLVGRLIHTADAGDFIRKPEDYGRLLPPVLVPAETRLYRSGWCDYGLWLARKASPA